MKKLIFLTTLFVTLAATAQEQSEYDQNAPFGFCTVSSRYQQALPTRPLC